MQNLSHDWPNDEPMLWAKDGPMSKSYVGPFKIYNHGPIVRRPMGQWRANVYVLSGMVEGGKNVLSYSVLLDTLIE